MEILFKGVNRGSYLWAEGDYMSKNSKIRLDCGDIVPIYPETLCQFTGLYDATKWQELTDDQRDKWTLNGNTPSEWKGWKLFSDDLISDGDRTIRIYMTEGGFAIKWHYWCSDISDLTPLDELILQPLPDAKTRSWIEGSCKFIGNIHDKKQTKWEN